MRGIHPGKAPASSPAKLRSLFRFHGSHLPITYRRIVSLHDRCTRPIMYRAATFRPCNYRCRNPTCYCLLLSPACSSRISGQGMCDVGLRVQARRLHLQTGVCLKTTPTNRRCLFYTGNLCGRTKKRLDSNWGQSHVLTT